MTIPVKTWSLPGLTHETSRYKRTCSNNTGSMSLHYVPWQWLTKTLLTEPFLLEQDFYWACAACCWDTVWNPGLIAMHWVQRAPLWPLVYCVNRRSHSKSKFGDREQDLTSPGVRASATSKADRDLGRAWFLFLIQGDKRGFARTVNRWLTYNRPL